MKSGLCIFDVPTCLIITKQKIGTQFIRSFFNNDLQKNLMENEYDVTCEYSIDLINNKYITNPILPDVPWKDKFKYHQSSLDNFLNKDDFNKDVVVLIRDPRKRFISALIQDFIKPFLEPNNSRVIEVLGQMLLREIDLDWWVRNRNQIVEYVNDRDNQIHITEGFKLRIEKIIKVILDGYINGNYPIDSYHNSPYHETLQLILTNPKNKSKIKVFDIDDTHLNDVFSKYKPQAHLSRVNKSHNQLVDITKKLVYENPILKSKIEEGQIKEIESYNFIKEKFI